MNISPRDQGYARLAAALERSERWPRERIESYRDQLLTRLVSFAHEQSPFYRERLRPLFRSGGRPDLRAWRDIPILRRSELESEIDRINPAKVPDDVGRVSDVRTSGTAGDRMAVRTCALARNVAECMMSRLYRWNGFDLTAAMASIRFYSEAGRKYPEGLTDTQWSYPGPEAPHHTLDLREPVGKLIEWLARRRPTYLLTFPSIAHEMAEHRDAFAIDKGALKAIVGISEIVTADACAAVRGRFGCEIAQVYACSEIGCIALQSPADDQYLVCEESALVEILNEKNEPAAPGEVGRVVLTGFYNYATPFIRYEIDDYAAWSEEPCPTGRTLKRLKCVEGKRCNALVAPRGRRIWQSAIAAEEILSRLPARQFQIRQSDPGMIELAYVPTNTRVVTDRAGLTAYFMELFNRPVVILLKPVPEIPRTAGGKHERIVSSIAR